MGRTRKLSPIHPGEILLEDFIKPLGLTMNRLAADLHVPANRIAQIVAGKRAITGETALRLARYFGNAPEVWTGLQTNYDLRIARDKFEAEVTRQIKPRRQAA